MPETDISIEKTPLREINDLCVLYDAKNIKGQKLFVKFIKNKLAHELGVSAAIDFNREVLSDL